MATVFRPNGIEKTFALSILKHRCFEPQAPHSIAVLGCHKWADGSGSGEAICDPRNWARPRAIPAQNWEVPTRPKILVTDHVFRPSSFERSFSLSTLKRRCFEPHSPHRIAVLGRHKWADGSGSGEAIIDPEIGTPRAIPAQNREVPARPKILVINHAFRPIGFERTFALSILKRRSFEPDPPHEIDVLGRHKWADGSGSGEAIIGPEIGTDLGRYRLKIGKCRPGRKS